ncbi:MAG: amino acid adenylation domain-containing protein [Cyanobacteria bacterium J06626_26]
MAENARLKQEAIAKRLATLSPQKREAFLKLLQKEGIDPTKLPILPANRQTNTFPLSWSQERLYFGQQLDGPSATYNIPVVLKINGTVQVDALEKTLDAIARRHNVLRTTFDTVDGKPVQIVYDVASSNWPLNIENWQDWAFDSDGKEHPELNAKIHAFTHQQTQKSFDLTAFPLARATLVQLSATRSILFLEVHHIIWDAWSIGVFSQEFALFYKAYSQGQTPAISPLSIQYTDYAVWQRQWLLEDALTDQLDYWKQQFSDAPALLELPTDHPRPSVQSLRGNTHIMRLDPALSQQVNSLAQKHQVTLFMVLLAAFQVLLHRYSGQDDIVVGTSIANRQRAELEPLLGFFINNLPLRTHINDDDTVSELLRQVRRTTLDAYAHQDVPFEQIVDALQPKRTLAHSPVFQVLFVLQNAPMTALELPGLTLTPLAEETQIAKFDLTLEIENSAQGLVGYWIYNSDLFDADTVVRMGHHFEALLKAMVEDESQSLGSLSLLSAEERQQILIDWNDTAVSYPQAQHCIHELFEQQVNLTPEAVAVVYGQEQLSYQDLNNKANQLAHYLRDQGVGPDTLVGICVERCLEMVIGLLAILKAGGAYVPLDPDYPSQRLQFMLSDAKISMLLSQTHLLDRLPEMDTKMVLLDRDWSDIAQSSTEQLSSEVTPDHLAYVIYTSGSTGRPKGVMIPHRGLVNYLSWAIQTYEVATGNGAPVHSSIGFDATITGLFAPLLVGKPVLLLSPQQEVESLGQALQSNQQFSLVKLTPAHLELLNQMLQPEALADQTQALVIGGEALMGHQLRFWQTHAPGTRLINEYGPTETVVGCCVYETDETTDFSEAIPIGRPIANTQLYILDAYQQPVPVGVSGELHIGGAGVARGYLNRPELTQEKFIENPFGEGRLYKTGDLARYRTDGTIEYLGRIDYQVKLRGFRIELGEIEAVLARQVQQCVVILREDTPGNRRLAAYVVGDGDLEDGGDSLKDYLKQHLPDYMVPNVLVPLESLPLTANGKIDRSALDAPEAVSSQEFVAPQTDEEIILAEIWQDILGQEKIGIRDNFFELGGDSILSIQMIAQARKAGLSLRPKQLFQYQTISELAYASVNDAKSPVLANQGHVTGPVPLTPIQQWFLDQQWSNPHHFNQAILLQVPANLQADKLRQSLAYLVAHHDALRLRFEQRDGQWHQAHVEDNVEIPLEKVDLSSLSVAEQGEKMGAIATQKQASLHLSQGPIGRVILFDLGSQQWLLIIFHHLVIDGVSWRILLGDLWELYNQSLLDQSLQLPPKTTAYQDWSRQLETYSQSDDLNAQLDYWLNLPWSQAASLPMDMPNAPNHATVAETATLSNSLSAEETEQLLQQVPDAYNTQINDALLTALGDVIGSWTGSHTVLINLEGHGREPLVETIDVSRTVGWFTSLYPVLLITEPQESPGENLKAIKEYLRKIPQGGIGYGLLHYTANIAALRALPTPQISVNYLGQIDKGIDKGLDADWSLAPEPASEVYAPDGNRPHLIDINIQTVAGKLQIHWSYSRAHHHPATIEQLAQDYIHALKQLIDHCLSTDTGGHTPSDFPMVDLSQADLDDVMQQLS